MKAGGKGDTSAANTIWTGRDTARFASPLVYQSKIYYFANGVANCIDATDGSSIFKGRLPAKTAKPPASSGARENPRSESQRPQQDRAGSSQTRPNPGGFGARGGFGGGRGGRGGFGGADYSSPVAGDGKVYYFKNDGTAYVINASDEFELLSTNQIAEGPETFRGTPALSDGQIVVRSNRYLYCIDANQ